MMKKQKNPSPPKHLRAATRKWWSEVVAAYELESQHLRLLTLAAESWDRGQEAREVIAKAGLTFNDRFDQPRARPEVAIARDSSIVFARLVRELCLDISPPDEAERTPRRPGTGG
jgi:phage terminase small subunit